MGAEVFTEVYSGDKSIKDAFAELTEQAAWDYGHSGYTGTIAEKTEFVLRSKKVFDTREEAETWADHDLDIHDHDKWGPAWAVKFRNMDKEGFIFYGWASS